MKLRNSHALVTGAASGIGREICRELLERGAHVIATDRSTEALANCNFGIAAAGGQLERRGLDVCEAGDAQKICHDLLEQGRHLNLLINNAGITHAPRQLSTLDDSRARRVFEVNFWGTLQTTHALLPLLQSANFASLVHIASMAALVPFPGQAAYSASKAALASCGASMATELRPHGIRVSTIFLGAVNTKILDHAVGLSSEDRNIVRRLRGTGQAMSPSLAAKKIVDGIESGKTRHCIGTDARVIEILARLMPQTAPKLLDLAIRRLAPGLLENMARRS